LCWNAHPEISFMSVLGIDLGGTKLSLAVFSNEGKILNKDFFSLDKRTGKDVGKLITRSIKRYVGEVQAIGISVPGISRAKFGTVWAPNIPGWDDYPLLNEVQKTAPDVPVIIMDDRACSISGEQWQGAARNCRDAIFLAVGTGIGAGILCDGRIINGANDIAGAIGWMALQKPFDKKYIPCGCFEYYASGEGIARLASEKIAGQKNYNGALNQQQLSSYSVFEAYTAGDSVAKEVIKECIEYWGMACANLVSIFNPERIVFGGGVFGPAAKFIPLIEREARQWAQPISIRQVEFVQSELGTDAALIGAANSALQRIGNA
jgi:glucokinase